MRMKEKLRQKFIPSSYHQTFSKTFVVCSNITNPCMSTRMSFTYSNLKKSCEKMRSKVSLYVSGLHLPVQDQAVFHDLLCVDDVNLREPGLVTPNKNSQVLLNKLMRVEKCTAKLQMFNLLSRTDSMFRTKNIKFHLF